MGEVFFPLRLPPSGTLPEKLYLGALVLKLVSYTPPPTGRHSGGNGRNACSGFRLYQIL